VTQQKPGYKEALDLYTHIVNSSDDFMNIVDRNYCYVAVSDPLCRAFQRSRETLVGKSVAEIWGVDQFEAGGIRNRLDHCLAGNQLEHEFEFSFLDKGLRWYNSRFTPYRDQHGCVTHAVVISHDVTERVEAAQALQESRDRLEFLLHSAPVVLYSRKAEKPWSLNFVSQNIRQHLGYDEQELLQDCDVWAQRLHEEDRAQLSGALESLCEKGRSKLEYRVRTELGSYRWLCDEMVLIRSEKDDADEIVGYWSDITGRIEAEQDRVRLQTQLEHSQRLDSLGVLAGGIAHDFNNILAAIMGNASLAEFELQSSPQNARKYIDRVVLSSEKAAELCRQMLAYSGKGSFDIKPVNLTQMVEETHRLLEVSIPKQVSLVFDLDRSLPSVDADATQMQQIIMNLVINAADAIGEKKGLIRIETGCIQADTSCLSNTYLDHDLSEGRCVYLDVADTGCGMDEQTLTNIFEPFFTTKFAGRGLGMSAVLGIIRSHHGAIKVDSTVGKGTTFRLLLPAHSGEVTAAVEKKDDSQSRCSGTVLLVDDDEDVCISIAVILKSMGYDVLTASDGMKAVEVYRKHGSEITVVLMDMAMPNLDGKACYAELKKINHNVKVILSSGYSEASAGEWSAGLCGFIQKPYRPEALKSMLQQAMSSDELDR